MHTPSPQLPPWLLDRASWIAGGAALAGLALAGWWLHRDADTPLLSIDLDHLTETAQDTWLEAVALVAPARLTPAQRASRALSGLSQAVGISPPSASADATAASDSWLAPAMLGAALGAGVALGLDRALRDRTQRGILDTLASLAQNAPPRPLAPAYAPPAYASPQPYAAPATPSPPATPTPQAAQAPNAPDDRSDPAPSPADPDAPAA